MKTPRLSLAILALGIMAGAGAWGWQQWFSNAEPASPGRAQVSKPKAKSAASPKSAAAPHRTNPAMAPDGKSQGVSWARGHSPPISPNGPAKPSAGRSDAAPVLSEQELQRRAARVEQEANHDLKHLVGLLGLDDAQQNRVFDTLVRHSPEWHPAMQPVGVMVPGSGSSKVPPHINAPDHTDPAESSTPIGSGTLLDAIAADLTPAQQTELANAELDRQEWWEAIITQLMPDSDTPLIHVASAIESGSTTTGTAATAAPPPAEEGPAENKSGDDSGILIE